MTAINKKIDLSQNIKFNGVITNPEYGKAGKKPDFHVPVMRYLGSGQIVKNSSQSKKEIIKK